MGGVYLVFSSFVYGGNVRWGFLDRMGPAIMSFFSIIAVDCSFKLVHRRA